MSTVTFNPGATLKGVHNDDGHITDKEWNDWAKWYESNHRGKDIIFGGQQYTLAQLQDMRTKGLIADSGQPPASVPANSTDIKAQTAVVTQLHAQLEGIDQQVAQLKTQLQAEEKKTGTAKKDALIKELKLKIRTLESKKQVKIAKQKANLIQLNRMHGAKKVQGKASWWTMAGMKVPPHLQGKDDGKGGVSASMQSGKAATANAPQQQQQTSGKTQSGAKSGKAATTGGWGPTSGWGGKAMTGPSFSAGAYGQSLFMEDSIMGSWDNINKSQNRGKELMQLLFYYMRMAMSGDLTAMYNMMKAVLYIISKDKALQQCHMAGKLIQLQDDSRRATDKLLNFNADQKDPNSQMEFTKLLQQVKSESDSVATSQKLIAQMMEEMAQIVETLTNVTKGALDASGRVLRTVSRFT